MSGKEKNGKNLITIIQVVCIIFLSLSVTYVFKLDVSAYSASENKLNTNFVLTGNGAEDIVAVAKAQMGKKYPEFSGFHYRAWCADFVSACASAANVSDVVPGAAAVTTLRTALKNAGGIEYSKSTVQSGGYIPKRGDIIIFKSNGDSHVGIVDYSSGSTIYYIDGNWCGNGNGNDARVHYSNRSNSYSGFTCIIAPKYKNSPTHLNLGDDFYAYIINTTAWTHVTPDLNGTNIFVQKGDAANKVWHFERLGNGSYKITAVDGRCMEVHNFESANGTNVELHEYNDNSAQHWFIYGESASFRFRAECGNNVLDMNGGNSADGTNIQMWEWNDTSAQKFQIWRMSNPTPGYMGCGAGTRYTPTNIWWEEGSNADSYDLRLWKDGEEYKTLWSLKETSISLDLPEGEYKATVAYCNGYTFKMGMNELVFTVGQGEPVDYGDGKYVTILINNSWIPIVNDGDNVKLREGSVSEVGEYWKLEKQSDGSYVIRSMKNNKVLDVEEAADKNYANVHVYDYTGADNQKWYIYGRWSGEYYLKPKCSSRVLDVTGGENKPGDNIALFDLNYSGAQKFAIWENDVPGATELKCTAGNCYSPVKFTWKKTDHTTGYSLKIWLGKHWEGEMVKTVSNVGANNISASVMLPPGEYEAYVDSGNDYAYQMSNVVKFTVSDGKPGTPVNLGSGFCAKLYGSYNWIPVVNTKGRVEVKEEKNSQSQIWRFERQPDGSYIIINLADENVLTVEGAIDNDGTAVIAAKRVDSDNQKWFVYGEKSGEYILQPKMSHRVLDITGGANNPGDPLELYRLNYTNAQLFAIEKTGDIELGTPSVRVTSQPDQKYNLLFSWNSCMNVTEYDLVVYNAEGTEILCQYNDLTETKKETMLPVGDYQVRVYAKNGTYGLRKAGVSVAFRAKKSLKLYTMQLGEESFTYDGMAKRPRISLVDSEGKELLDSEYTVSYEDNIDAGTAIVTVTGSDYYPGIISGTFTIGKALQDLKIVSENRIFTDSDAIRINVEGFGTFTYSSDDKEVATVNEKGIVQGHKPGTVTISINASGDMNHYQAKKDIKLTFVHGYGEGIVTKEATCEEDGIRMFTCAGCGNSYTEAIQALGHDWDESVEVKKITCTEDGETIYTCRVCGKQEREIVKSMGHLGEMLVENAKEATCATSGYTGDVYCSVCKEVVKEGTIIEPMGHRWDKGTIIKEPTVSETGVIVYYCTMCGEKTNEILPATGEEENDSEDVRKNISGYDLQVEATEYEYDGTEKRPMVQVVTGEGNVVSSSAYELIYENNVNAGTAKVTATGIGSYRGSISAEFTIRKAVQTLTVEIEEAILTDNETAKITVKGIGKITYSSGDSTLLTVASDGTITAKKAGTTQVTVNASGSENYYPTWTTITVKISHDYDSGEVIVKPSCNENGVRNYTCAGCGNSYTEEIPATGHMWDNGVVEKQVACGESGVFVYTCRNCGETEREVLEAAVHIGKEITKFAREAECEADGYTGDVYCSVCGELIQKGEAIPMIGHEWNKKEEIKAVTCADEGISIYICTRCGAEKEEVVPAKGHSSEVEVRNWKAATCTEGGYTGDIYCSVCEELLREGDVIPMVGHEWNEGEEIKAATCTKEGIRAYTCTRCGAEKEETVLAKGHSSDVEVKNQKEVTCTEDGYTGDICCEVCGELVLKGEIIPATGHNWDSGIISRMATVSETGIRIYTCQICGKKREEIIETAGFVSSSSDIVNKENDWDSDDADNMEDLETYAEPGTMVVDVATKGVYVINEDGMSLEYYKASANNVKNVVIPNVVTVNGRRLRITSIAPNAFRNKRNLVRVTIGKNVQIIGSRAFSGCRKLTKVTGGASVEYIEASAFEGCVKLTKITLGTKLEEIGAKAFKGCISLEKITIPARVEYIGKRAFYGCKKLKNIVIRTSSLDGRSVGTKAFSGTPAKTVVSVPRKMSGSYKRLFRSKGMSSRAKYKKF